MPTIGSLLSISLIIAGTCPSLAAEAIPLEGRLGVGNTGINCVKEPCPWRGIVDLDNTSRDPLRPHWHGKHLPATYGQPEDVARLKKAWDDGECLEIEGKFGHDGAPWIEIGKIIGPC